ncbi:hypothetical protein Q9295_15690 [Xinfangfangia sp. CPCC 101601]|uniref:Uncharacterized protein n=1 Tax=Pseudogemmobacter lacusdianii TaxID=3069608 RepID=A0ABU0W1E0_9RHOB|nr:hypothetical protein [Xinfangfangia sp. CPCC 101601]MDQ2067819.1 hypothetical protein [Xinfangfangia sp. CPCC 101601]
MASPPTPPRRPVVLINAEALFRIDLERVDNADAVLLVAGSQIVDMTLAELAVPGAQMIWTDFRQSSSLGRLHQEIDALGGLDQMVLAGDGARAEVVFSMMCALLSLLPALRRPRQAQVTLMLDDGPAVANLQEFLTRLSPGLAQHGILVTLELSAPQMQPPHLGARQLGRP